MYCRHIKIDQTYRCPYLFSSSLLAELLLSLRVGTDVFLLSPRINLIVIIVAHNWFIILWYNSKFNWQIFKNRKQINFFLLNSSLFAKFYWRPDQLFFFLIYVLFKQQFSGIMLLKFDRTAEWITIQIIDSSTLCYPGILSNRHKVFLINVFLDNNASKVELFIID